MYSFQCRKDADAADCEKVKITRIETFHNDSFKKSTIIQSSIVGLH